MSLKESGQLKFPKLAGCPFGGESNICAGLGCQRKVLLNELALDSTIPNPEKSKSEINASFEGCLTLTEST